MIKVTRESILLSLGRLQKKRQKINLSFGGRHSGEGMIYGLLIRVDKSTERKDKEV